MGFFQSRALDLNAHPQVHMIEQRSMRGNVEEDVDIFGVVLDVFDRSHFDGEA